MGDVYLDNAAAPRFLKSSLLSYLDDLTKNHYSNPHSRHSPSARASLERIDSIRKQILDHFDADPSEFSVIFAPNATGALKLLADTFPWSNDDHIKAPKSIWDGILVCVRVILVFVFRWLGVLPVSRFVCLRESHTSVVGIREVAKRENALAETVSEEDVEDRLFSTNPPRFPNLCLLVRYLLGLPPRHHLFAYPAQCNFSGTRFPLSWCSDIRECLSTQNEKWWTLLDASSYASTSHLSLNSIRPDFTVVSFYKLFGFPTNIGALIVRHAAASILRKGYFGGGTVSALSPSFHVFRPTLHDRFEDGTLPFLELIALSHCFTSFLFHFNSFTEIHDHTMKLTSHIYSAMTSLRHYKGAPVCEVYRLHSDPHRNGPIINFNLRRANGSYVSYVDVERLASTCRIHVRAGGFCNAGAQMYFLNLSEDDVKKMVDEGRECGEDDEEKVCDGRKANGSVRISIGALTTQLDVSKWMAFLNEFFVETELKIDVGGISKDVDVSISNVSVYPIKSCHGFQPLEHGFTSWPILPRGLLYDREWMLVEKMTNRPLNQKKYPKMCLIRPFIHDKELVVHYPGSKPLLIPLASPISDLIKKDVWAEGKKCEVWAYCDNKIDAWFTLVLKIPCCFVRIPASSSKKSFSNESAFLLTTEASLDSLRHSINDGNNHNIKMSSFRPNISIKGGFPYMEDHIQYLKIGSQVFKVMEPCRRCLMVCIDQDTSERRNEIYKTLAKTRRHQGKIIFGHHLQHVQHLSQRPYSLALDGNVSIIW